MPPCFSKQDRKKRQEERNVGEPDATRASTKAATATNFARAMRSLCNLIALLLVVANDAAATRRLRRQVVPLLSTCGTYATCSPPAVCMSGQCQCTQPYVAMDSSCVSAYPRMMSPVYTSNMAATYLHPQQALLHYPVSMQAAPAPPQTVMYQPQNVVAPPPPPSAQQPQPLQLLQPPEQQPGQVISQEYEPSIATATPVTTSALPRLFDAPSIAYPGEFCQIPQTVCVGGSLCLDNVCVCRRGEEPINGQCDKIEVPFETVATPGTTSATTSQSSATISSTKETTSLTNATTEAPATTVPLTTPPPISPHSTIASTVPSGTTEETTATPSPTTTIPYIGRIDEFSQDNPYRCVSCCQPNAQNCQPQVIRINLSYSMQRRRCLNSFDCQRGTSCNRGVCR